MDASSQIGEGNNAGNNSQIDEGNIKRQMTSSKFLAKTTDNYQRDSSGAGTAVMTDM
jgi:hypothetical protein